MGFEDNKKYNNVLLWKSLTSWGWYKDVPTKVVFIHCLLRANYKEGVWKGIKYKRGQFVTSYKHLAIETGLTERQVRTAISHLELTHEVTRSSTHRYTLITVNNYDIYQTVSDKVSDKQKSHKRHTNDTPLTTVTLYNTNNTNNTNNSADASGENEDEFTEENGWIQM